MPQKKTIQIQFIILLIAMKEVQELNKIIKKHFYYIKKLDNKDIKIQFIILLFAMIQVKDLKRIKKQLSLCMNKLQKMEI